MHIAALPDGRAVRDPDGLCIADERQTLDNKGFASTVKALAGWLDDHEVGPGDVVAVMLPNRVELVTLLFAAWHVGAAVTPLNPALTAEETNYQLADSGAKLVIVGPVSIAKIDHSLSEVVPVDQVSAPESSGEPPPLRARTWLCSSTRAGQPAGQKG